jgi:hypothetical protein
MTASLALALVEWQGPVRKARGTPEASWAWANPSAIWAATSRSFFVAKGPGPEAPSAGRTLTATSRRSRVSRAR